MTLLFKNYSLVEFIHLLIRFNKTKSLGQNTHTTQREKYNFKKGQLMLLSDTSYFSWENSGPLLFGKIQKTQTFPFYKFWRTNVKHKFTCTKFKESHETRNKFTTKSSVETSRQHFTSYVKSYPGTQKLIFILQKACLSVQPSTTI